jgi:hypothetical protein
MKNWKYRNWSRLGSYWSMFVFDILIVLHQGWIYLSRNSCCECQRFEYLWEICWNCRVLVNFTIILYWCEGFLLIDTVCVVSVSLTLSTLITGFLAALWACCKGNLTVIGRILHLDLAKGNPKRMLWGSLARSVYKWYTEDYSTKPPSTEPPIYRCPCDSRECRSVTRTCPDASVAHLVLFRSKWWRGSEVVDFWWVDIQKVIRLLGMEVVGFRCGPWRWYRGVGSIRIDRGKWGG